MNQQQLRTQFRLDADDTVSAYVFSDAEVNAWLVEAEEEAALRADLLFEADSAPVCQIAAVAGTRGYALHAAITRVTRATWTPAGATEATKLTLITRLELDRLVPGWRTLEEAPTYAMVENHQLRLGSIPLTDGTINLECYRMPLTPMAADADSPEIPAKHHRRLIQWALYRGYNRPDTEGYDASRAGRALDEFERHFGLRPDADARQAYEIAPQFNQAY